MTEYLDRVARPGLLKNPLPEDLSTKKFGEYTTFSVLKSFLFSCMDQLSILGATKCFGTISSLTAMFVIGNLARCLLALIFRIIASGSQSLMTYRSASVRKNLHHTTDSLLSTTSSSISIEPFFFLEEIEHETEY